MKIFGVGILFFILCVVIAFSISLLMFGETPSNLTILMILFFTTWKVIEKQWMR